MNTPTALKEKTFIITGANAGIGRAAAHRLAELGAEVIMACRSQERGERAREEIIAATGNENVHLMLVDMASQESIRQFAEAFNARFSRLDALINNAAHFDLSIKTPQFTPEGAEAVFATNHLGPFLLTHLLLDRLKASAPSRVVNISSMGLVAHPFIKINFDDLSTSRSRAYSVSYAYYHSKLAHVMFTRELAKRLDGTGVTANAIRVPNVRIDVSRYPDLPPLLLRMYDIKQRFAITPEEMAATYVRIASDPAFEHMTGLSFDEKCSPVRMPRFAYDDEATARLWEISEQMVGLA